MIPKKLKVSIKEFLRLYIKLQLTNQYNSRERKAAMKVILDLQHRMASCNGIYGEKTNVTLYMIGVSHWTFYIDMDSEIRSWLLLCLRQALPKYSVIMRPLNHSLQIYIFGEPFRGNLLWLTNIWLQTSKNLVSGQALLE